MDQVKATQAGRRSHVTLEAVLAEHKDAVLPSCERMQQTPMLQCHHSIKPVAFN